MEAPLAAVLGLRPPVTKGKELTLKLLWFLLCFFPPPFSGFAVSPWRSKLWIFCCWFFCLICRSDSLAVPEQFGVVIWLPNGERRRRNTEIPD